MKVTLLHTGRAFLPELTAYERYLRLRGLDVTVLYADDVAVSIADGVCYRFGGFLRADNRIKAAEIHEYHSASLGRAALLKNFLKARFSVRPTARVFLNEFVRDQFDFSDKAPYVYRDMGADDGFFLVRGAPRKLYDVVYAGSISGRDGLVRHILELASRGLRVGVAGNADPTDAQVLHGHANVHFVGRLPLQDVPKFIASGHVGLNFCPDIYPFNRQTSTKVIEYLAAGIPIASNHYKWINEHSKTHGYITLALDTLSPRLAISDAMTLPPDVTEKFRWSNILDSIDFVGFISLVGNKSV